MRSACDATVTVWSLVRLLSVILTSLPLVIDGVSLEISSVGLGDNVNVLISMTSVFTSNTGRISVTSS